MKREVTLTLHEMRMGKSQADILKERILEDLEHAALLDGMARRAVNSFIDHVTLDGSTVDLEGFTCTANLDYSTLHPHLARALKNAALEEKEDE